MTTIRASQAKASAGRHEPLHAKTVTSGRARSAAGLLFEPGAWRHAMLVCALLSLVLTSQAQSTQPLRDSLARATEELAFHPDSTDLRLKKAAWNIQLEQWEYALDEYTRILNRQPDCLAALFYRAYANERLHRYGFARLDYESLLNYVPGNFEALLGLALLNQKDHHYTEASDQINRLVQQHPDSAVAYAARAGIEAERGQLELAVYDYGEAIRRAPANPDFIIARIDLLARLGRKGEALEDVERAVRLGIPRAQLVKLLKKK